MTSITRTIVSSPAGFELLQLTLEHDGFSATPIIAWEIIEAGDPETSIETHPLCANSWVNDFTRNGIVRQPDGSILFLDSVMTFEKGDEAEALKYALWKRHQFKPA